MSCGIEVSGNSEENCFGVPQNFTIFTGQQLLEKNRDYQLLKQLPNSEEPNVDRFLTAVSNSKEIKFVFNLLFLFIPEYLFTLDASTRMTRIIKYR
jgi:hypothetical protein